MQMFSFSICMIYLHDDNFNIVSFQNALEGIMNSSTMWRIFMMIQYHRSST